MRRLGHIWYDSLWRYHGISKEKIKSLERETVSLDPLPDEGKEGEEKSEDSEEKKDEKKDEEKKDEGKKE